MHPAKAIGQNEMPFGRDTRVAHKERCIRRVGPVTHGKGKFGRSEPPIAAISRLPQTVNIFTSII